MALQSLDIVARSATTVQPPSQRQTLGDFRKSRPQVMAQ
jgi:hypothetical protein